MIIILSRPQECKRARSGFGIQLCYIAGNILELPRVTLFPHRPTLFLRKDKYIPMIKMTNHIHLSNDEGFVIMANLDENLDATAVHAQL